MLTSFYVDNDTIDFLSSRLFRGFQSQNILTENPSAYVSPSLIEYLESYLVLKVLTIRGKELGSELEAERDFLQP
jgi:hypothetical protein